MQINCAAILKINFQFKLFQILLSIAFLIFVDAVLAIRMRSRGMTMEGFEGCSFPEDILFWLDNAFLKGFVFLPSPSPEGGFIKLMLMLIGNRFR